MLLANCVEAADARPDNRPGPVRVAPERLDPAGATDRLIRRSRSQLDKTVGPAHLLGPEQRAYVKPFDRPRPTYGRGAQEPLPKRLDADPA